MGSFGFGRKFQRNLFWSCTFYSLLICHHGEKVYRTLKYVFFKITQGDLHIYKYI